jgi:hypothetical protein
MKTRKLTSIPNQKAGESESELDLDDMYMLPFKMQLLPKMLGYLTSS